jgi:hypothetical protein
MAPEKCIFLRNDDVRESLDKELIKLTELSIKYKFPISHAVEPANVSGEVVEWLLDVKRNNPTLIEIIQHGYDHNNRNPHIKMEFGGTRTFTDQYNTITKGKELMDSYFGDLWSPVFTFPYGTYNEATLKAIEGAGYKAISGKITFSAKNKLKNLVGRSLGRNFIFNKKVSYHCSKRQMFSFYEFSVSANLIRKYLDNKNAIHYTTNEVFQQIEEAASHTDKIGVLFHHRFHSDHFSQIDEILATMKDKYTSSTIMSFIR